MAKVLLTGGTGLIGTALSKHLAMHGFEVNILTRTPKKTGEYRWNLTEGYIDKNAFEGVEFIIHLAGAGIADKRWTATRKQEIIDSRVLSIKLLLKKVKEYNVSLKAFISASGIGYYGATTSERVFIEEDSAHGDFISEVCQNWEAAALTFEKEGIRTVILRTGIVLSANGGALSKMKTPIVTPIGSGKQYLPWIHIDDLCSMYLKAVKENNLSGIFNAVAPEHHNSKSFSKALANRFKRPFLPIGAPGFMLRLLFGELAVILLEGSRISCEKIISTGFQFQFGNLQEALKKC